MKKCFLIILSLCLLLSAAGCGGIADWMVPPAEEEPQSSQPVYEPVIWADEETPVEDPPVTSENETEAPTQEQNNPAETEKPPEETAEPAEPEEPPLPEDRLDADSHIGIWSAASTELTDPVSEYHNAYVCLFENGWAVRFTYRYMDFGSWSEADGSEIRVSFFYSLYHEPGPGWQTIALAADSTYVFDPEESVLWQTGCSEDSPFSAQEVYYPAIRVSAIEKALECLDQFAEWRANTVLTQWDMNYTAGLSANLYDGLEQVAFGLLLDTYPKMEEDLTFSENCWKLELDGIIEEAGKPYESETGQPGTMQSLAKASTRATLVRVRIAELLQMIS